MRPEKPLKRRVRRKRPTAPDPNQRSELPWPPGQPIGLVVPECDSAGELLAFTEILTQALALKPPLLVLRFVGVHQMHPDSALLIHHLLQKRDPAVRVRTEAMSPLLAASVLVWLAGDERFLRPTAWILFPPHATAAPRSRRRRIWAPSDLDDEEDGEADEQGVPPHPLTIDLATVLDLLNQHLPVRELGGQPVRPATLHEFGLMGTDPIHHVLAEGMTAAGSVPTTGEDREQPTANPSRGRRMRPRDPGDAGSGPDSLP